MADALDLLIAQGPPKWDLNLSGLVDDYQKGRDYQYQNRNRDLFKGGLPQKDGEPDFTQAFLKLLQAGGAQGVPNAVLLSGLEAQREPSLLMPPGQQAQARPQQQGGAAGAIASIESGGNYEARGPVTRTGDRAYGKYQVMGANVGPWTKEALGQELSPEQFEANPKAQDAVFKHKFGQYLQETGDPQKAALKWFTGRSDDGALKLKDQNGVSGAGYQQKFAQAGGGAAPQSRSIPGLVPPAWVGREGEYARALADRASRREAIKPGSGKALQDVANSIIKSLEPSADLKKFHETQDVKGFEDFQGRDEEKKRESAYIVEVNKGYGTLFNDMMKAGRDAGTTLGTYGLMERLVDDPKFYSGTGGETATKIKRFLVSAGIADAAAAGPNELFQKLANKLVVDTSGGSLGTGFSNADRSFIERATANIDNTPAGNKAILGVGRKVEARKQQIAQRAREYAKAHDGKIDAGFDDELATWAEKTPLFPAPEGGPQNKPPPAAPVRANAPARGAAQAAPGGIPEGATATHPQTKERIIRRGGQWVPLQQPPVQQAPLGPGQVPEA